MGKDYFEIEMAPKDTGEKPDRERTKQQMKKLRLSEAISAMILAISEDAIISIDENLKIALFSEGAEKMYGFSTAEVIGKPIDVLIPAGLREDYRQHIRDFIEAPEDIRRMGELDGDYIALRRNGEEFYVSAAVFKMTVNGKLILTVSVHDITERKYFEKALKSSNQELNDFAYIVSHDLKEATRGILHFSNFLQEDYAEKLDENGKKMLAMLAESSEQMQKLINSLLEYSRVGRADLAFKPANLNQILKQTIELLAPTIGKNVTITIQDDFPAIDCDSVRVSEIFSNLIINAIKYNDQAHKTVEIGYTTSHPSAPGQPVIFVRDNGIGVPEDRRQDIFKMFRRLHGREAYGGGTGSGLAIVKKIVDRHGGDIWVESNKDRGSTFFFTLGSAATANPIG